MSQTENITSNDVAPSWDVASKTFGALAFLANTETKKTFVFPKEAIASYAEHAQMKLDPNSSNDILNIIIDAIKVEGSKVSEGKADLTGECKDGRGPYLAMGTAYTPPPEAKVLATLREAMEDTHYVVSAIIFQGEDSSEVFKKFEELEDTLIDNFEGLSCDMTVNPEPAYTPSPSSSPSP